VRIGGTALTLFCGDITQQDTEAIVNAANPTLLGGGGVDGAIHRAGGPAILAECRRIRETGGECPPGQAVITGGGNLKARYVIHTVGPVWRGGERNEEKTLENAYINSMMLAAQNQVTTISFPSISTGAYGFPIERACRVALHAVARFVRSHDGIREVRFIAFSQSDYEVYAAAMRSIPE
jgi:O-acetyl-ADP-ribose deacetylase (regulator of RNase III)